MNLPSRKITVEIGQIDGRYVVLYHVDLGAGSMSAPPAYRILTGQPDLVRLLEQVVTKAASET